MPIRLLADENFDHIVVRGLFRQAPALDLVRVQDVGLTGASDQTILAWAAANGRILLTHDRSTVPDFAYARLADSLPMTGVFVVDDRAAIRDCIDSLLLIDEESDTPEWNGQVIYLPW